MDKDGEVVYIGVGSNIDPKGNIVRALDLLQNQHELKVIGISSFYNTVPLDRGNQPNYLNGIFELRTSVSPEVLKTEILAKIEQKLKRERKEDKHASRTIDLDILLFGNLNSEEQQIPDPDIYTRNFIAVPLRELEPDLVLPDSGKWIGDLPSSDKVDSMKLDPDFTEELRERMIHEQGTR
jgi:dihydroneopterin aldolase/2-amino-4-hydroxy-6-hydroxymethyldihydropteridine diphosphokinase